MNAAKLLAIGLVLGLGVPAALAQQGGPPDTIRSLPAAAGPPPEAAQADRMAKEQIPEPPAKGQSKGRVLPAATTPPPDAVAAQRAAAQEIPPPPERARSDELLEKIRARPGGPERIEAAGKGRAPEKLQGRSGESTSVLFETLSNFVIERADAGDTFTLDLTPQVSGSYGQHRGLVSSSPSGAAYAYGAYIANWTPTNSSIYLVAYRNDNFAHQVSNPFIMAYANIPADGWYIVNVNANIYAPNLNIHHYENGNYVLLENMPKQSGWADYPTLQYLTAGYHYFYFVLTGSGYVSRVSFDSYP